MSVHREMVQVFTREATIETGKKNKALEKWSKYTNILNSIDPERACTFEPQSIRNDILKSPFDLLKNVRKHQVRETYVNFRRRTHLVMTLQNHSAKIAMELVNEMNEIRDLGKNFLGN